ncbi:MAG TPA: hypothetical protein VK181_01470, partial [Rhizobium sp.]|nr:hypothetical protein [Rhizobium sp.]
NYIGGTGIDMIIADASSQNIGVADISGIEKISGGAFSNVSIQTKAANNGSAVLLNLTGIELENINLIKGQNGDDSIYLEGSAGAASTALTRNDTVYGGAGNDSIYSGFGDDILAGDVGNDLLVGGAGLDTITGGAGADTFRFDAFSESVVGAGDKIIDFSSTDGDKIRLSSIDADASVSGDQAFVFIGSGMFSDVAGELRIELEADGFTHLYGDTNADSVADFEIVLTNGANLAATDFIL